MFDRYTPLTISQKDVLTQVEDKNILPKPPMHVGSKKDKSKYCWFHHDYGHDTEECFELKEENEAPIQRGQLRQFVSRLYRRNERPNNVGQPTQRMEGEPKLVKEIKTIMGGPSKFDTSHNSQKDASGK